MEHPRKLTLLSAVAALLAACDSSEPPPGPGQERPGLTVIDEREQVVYEIEQHLTGLTNQVREMSLQGVLEFYPDHFSGTPLLAAPPADRRVDSTIPGYVIETWKEEPAMDVTRDRIIAELARFLEPVATVDHARMKVLQGERNGDRYEADVKFVVDATLRSGGRWAIQARLATVLEKKDGAWRILSQARRSERRVRAERPTFVDVTETLNLEAGNLIGQSSPDLNPRDAGLINFMGGVAVGDVDGDGFPDILVNRLGSRMLYRNVEGRRFEDVTRRAQVWSSGTGTGALFFDINNDGHLDLLALNLSGGIWGKRQNMHLFLNDGTGRFENVTTAAGITDEGPAMSATAADIDGDGDLDFYVSFYVVPEFGSRLGMLAFPRRVLDARDGPPNRLWINNGDGTFTDKAAERGVADTGWSFAAAFGDYDDDGRPDLYVANDFGHNRLYHNLGGGRFEDVTAASGVGDVGFGMGVDWGDFDGDGKLDLTISNMYSTAGNRILNRRMDGVSPELNARLLKAARGNTLLRNKGDGTFEDVTEKTGVGPAGWAWDTHFLDYDNDGRLDLYVANGYVSGRSTTDL